MISKIANYLKYNYFWDGDVIENVTSRLWKFSYFCSRHTVGVAGDDIMFHILVPIKFAGMKKIDRVLTGHNLSWNFNFTFNPLQQNLKIKFQIWSNIWKNSVFFD